MLLFKMEMNPRRRRAEGMCAWVKNKSGHWKDKERNISKKTKTEVGSFYITSSSFS